MADDSVAKLDAHLAAQLVNSPPDFDMFDSEEDLAALTPFPQLKRALETIGANVFPVFKDADRAAIARQKEHRNDVRVAAVTGAAAIVLACIQLGFPQSSAWMVFVEVLAVGLCLFTIVVGLKAAHQDHWLVSRNVAERCRNLKFNALTHSDLWCESDTQWEQWLAVKVQELKNVAKRKDLHDWVTDEPLPDPPTELDQCAAASQEAGAVASYFRRKRVDYQHAFFVSKAGRHGTQSRRLRRIAASCFWISILAALLHFSLEFLLSQHKFRPEIHNGLELVARILIVVAAAAPALGAGIRTWLLAFEFGRSSLLYMSQQSCLDKRIKSLASASPATIFTAIWFTEQTLEQEHRAWVRLMVEAEWFG